MWTSWSALDDLNIYGVSADGSEVPVFVNGQWAWE